MTPPASKPGKVFTICMFFIDKHRRHAARAGIDVLVVTPRCKVNIPIVEFQRNVAGRMSQIKPHHTALIVASAGDFLYVEELSRVIVDATYKNEVNGFAFFFNCLHNVLRADSSFTVSWFELNNSVHWIITVETELRGDGVLV